VDARRILVAPNGVDTDMFQPALGREVVRARLDLGEGPVLGFVGSFKPWHGVAFLIEAFAEIVRQRPDARLLAIGEGPELESARARIVALGLERQCVFTGRLPHAEVPAHMAAMDISAAPYDVSGEFYFSPMKVVESLAAGVPVVAVRAGQLVALVDNGNTGLLYPPGDRVAFVGAVLSLMADPALLRAMGSNARERAVSGFSWKALVCRVMEKATSLERERQAA
jgi:glycosyltransferase involved in cell wall biosynthesis